MGIPAVQHANVIQLPNCTVGVDEACSGIRSLQSSIMAALFIGHLTLTKSATKILFLVLGVGLALSGNLLRSLYLAITAHRHGIEALEKAHDTAGWTVLAFTAVGLVVATRWGSRFDSKVREWDG